MLLGAPAQLAPGATWVARVRVTDNRGVPAWGAPAAVVLVDRASNATQRFDGGLTDRHGLARVRVRYTRPGSWAVTGVDGPARATVVGPPTSSGGLPVWSVAALVLAGLGCAGLLCAAGCDRSTLHAVRLVVVALLVLSAASCGEQTGGSPGGLERKARAAERVVGYRLVWVGRSIGGLPLTDVSRDPRSVTFSYGDCTPGPDAGCAPPLEVQVSSICERNALVLDTRPPARVRARGVQVLDYGDRLELGSATSNVVVFAAPALARRAIARLRPLSRPRHSTLTPARYPLYYLTQLRRVQDAYERTRSVRAVRTELGISKTEVRFELALAREIGVTRLVRGRHASPTLRDIKRAPPGGPRRDGCALEP